MARQCRLLLMNPYLEENLEKSPALRDVYNKTKNGSWNCLADLVDSARDIRTSDLIYISYIDGKEIYGLSEDMKRPIIINYLYECSLRALIDSCSDDSNDDQSLKFIHDHDTLESMITDFNDDNFPHNLTSCTETADFLEKVAKSPRVRLDFFLDNKNEIFFSRLVKAVNRRIKRLKYDSVQSEVKTYLVENPENYVDESMLYWDDNST